jgi:hypothetical protein
LDGDEYFLNKTPSSLLQKKGVEKKKKKKKQQQQPNHRERTMARDAAMARDWNWH